MNTIRHLKARRTLVSVAKFRKRAPAGDEGSIPPLSSSDVRQLAEDFEEQARACHREAAKLTECADRALTGVQFIRRTVSKVRVKALEMRQQAARNESDAAELRAEATRTAATASRPSATWSLSSSRPRGDRSRRSRGR